MTDQEGPKKNTSSKREPRRRKTAPVTASQETSIHEVSAEPVPKPTASFPISSRAKGFRLVNEVDGQHLYGNQYVQVGYMVDMWADLLEGYGYKVKEFWSAYDMLLNERSIEGLNRYWSNLSATGFEVPYRRMDFNVREPVTVAVYTAIQGEDLYVSWRAFVQGSFSMIKFIIFAGIAFVLALPILSFARLGKCAFTPVSFGGVPSCNLNLFEAIFILVFVGAIVAGFVAAFGILFRGGDFLALVREPIHELHYDDVASLTAAVHKSLLGAADLIGIDSTKLMVREPAFAPKNRPHLRF